MTISVVLVIIAIVTLGVGWISGQDPMIYVSILSSVIAGLLLIKSVLDDRRARTAAALAGTSTMSETSGYRPLEAEPVSMRDEPTLIGGDQVEEDMASEEDMGRMEPEMATVGATRSTRRGGATARRTTKPAASRAKTKTSSRAKTAATRAKAAPAKASAKAKTAGTKAKTAAKPKTGAARAKTTAKPKASGAKKSTTAKKSTAKKSTAKKSTARR